jgi:hypothetical protein
MRKKFARFEGIGLRTAAKCSAMLVFLIATRGAVFAQGVCSAANTVVADVVVFDTPIMFNRLGAQNPNWMTYALERDVVAASSSLPVGAGNAHMRPDKRVRPLVLRVNEGDCLQVNFKNWLTPSANPNSWHDLTNPLMNVDDQVAGRYAGFHVRGLQLATADSDSSHVGNNAGSLAAPGQQATYTYYAPPKSRGTYLVDSYGATFGGENSGGNTGQGLFGAVNVEPAGARWYRSQITEEEMRLASAKSLTPGQDCGAPNKTAAGQPIIDYEARYPAANCDSSESIWSREGKAGLPILNMKDGRAIVHSDLNAVIAGPNADGTFPPETYPLESAGKRNPALPNRLEAFREFTVIFHDEASAGQAFPGFFNNNPVTQRILHGVRDTFMINYGVGGAGAEIIANRLGVGPMWDCLTCSYEEFFLASSAVGDPAMIVDIPANVGLENCDITGAGCAATGPKATKAYYPDDPSNVHHSYQSDHVVFRNLHAGKEHHIFHLHNHQWLFDPNDDNSNYLDAQAIGPAGGYTYEINYGGSGNRNKSAGDAIFHCHFYPHFAQGMWELWRIHDVYETGTPLAASRSGYHSTPYALLDGTPAYDLEFGGGARSRALPDGEILAGTPIPALVPLPGKAMPLMPGKVVVVQKNANPGVDDDPEKAGLQEYAESSQAYVVERAKNPGYPFWIAGVDCGPEAAWNCTQGVVGQRPPTPALDMLTEAQAQKLRTEPGDLFDRLNDLGGGPRPLAQGGWDGGLPRHALDGIAAAGGHAAGAYHQEQTKLSFDKELYKAKPVWYPEGGTDLERVAMAFHAQRAHASTALRLDYSPPAPASYVTNGAPPQAGAPFFEPCVDDIGQVLTAGQAGRWFDANLNGGFVSLGASPFNASTPRVYKGALIQIDAVFNKLGYHYPQQRILSLWEDAAAYIDKVKPPEVFVIRNNTLDCTRFLHTNLAPRRFEVDDYQVTTPTDVQGQHIHLPKWDLPSADGSANGWNYEDGTLTAGSVRERIRAINAFNPTGKGNPINSSGSGANRPLAPLGHPYFRLVSQRTVTEHGRSYKEYDGARTTIQRWMFDPVLNIHHKDRGLGIIFTHDHYGPSTVQQVGLYASVLTEPVGSKWVHNETGVQLGKMSPGDTAGRDDGGPTSWQAAILPQPSGDQFQPFREFWFQHSDFQHAYEAGVYIGAGADGRPNGVLPNADSFRAAINPSVREFSTPLFPDVIRHSAICKDGTPRPCPEAISVDDPGFQVTNYRNEPVGWRVFDPQKIGPDGKPGAQADGLAGDLAFALQSRWDRKVPALNGRLGNTPYPALTAGIGNGDPFTPMMRAYAGDLIRIKSQAGGDEAEHNFSMHGIKWLQGGSSYGRAPNSGWRNSQQRGISEQFAFAAAVIPYKGSVPVATDYAYSHDTGGDGWWTGMWGVLRSYNSAKADLFQLPTTQVPLSLSNQAEFNGVCPVTAPRRTYDITAVLANDVLGNAVGATIPANIQPSDNAGGPLNPLGGTLVYNPRETRLAPPIAVEHGQVLPEGSGVWRSGPLHDPTAMLYVRTEDLVFPPGSSRPTGLRAGAPVEPLVLRANAGECIEVTLRNALPEKAPDLAGYSQFVPVVPRDKSSPQGVTWFGSNLVRPSSWVGIRPQLVAYDVSRDDSMVVGNNHPTDMMAPPGGSTTMRWYAGDLSAALGGRSVRLVATPIEFGGVNLMPADIIKHPQKGLVGALVIGPEASGDPVETDEAWDHQQADPEVRRETRASATIGGEAGIRDFVTVFQQGLNLRYKDGAPVQNFVAIEEPPGTLSKAINYGTEPMWFRFGLQPNVLLGNVPGGLGAVAGAELAYGNALVGGDPATPVFQAKAGDPVRFRLLYPAGNSMDDLHERGVSFHLHGHLWQRAPYVCPGQNDGLITLPGKCNWTNFGDPGFEVGSRAVGVNPIGMYLGSQDSVLPASHYDVVLPGAGRGPNGGAGGLNLVTGDYLFRDQGSFGNSQGLWGIMRVVESDGEPPPGGGGGGGGGGNPPVVALAVDDEISTPEDTPAIVSVLANDTYGGSPVIMGPGVSVVLLGGPLNGAAVINGDGTIAYTPDLNWAGVDAILYAVRVNGVLSPAASVAIAVTPVNDPPVASDDSAMAPVNTAVAIDVLANDVDVDGQNDLASAVELAVSSLPSGAAPPSLQASGGVVSFIASSPGMYTFTYKAQDSGGLRSAAATVTVAVSGVETIAISQAEFRTAELRWRVEGTDTLPVGQTLELRYEDGSYRTPAGTSVSVRGAVFATVVVGADGKWLLDATVGGAGIANPTNTAGNSNGFWVAPPQNLRAVSRLTPAFARAAIVKR